MSGPFPCDNTPSQCETNPNPQTSFSSESKDSTTFIGLTWNGKLPALNRPFNVFPCEAITQSQVSQEDADRLANNAVVSCSNPCAPTFSNSAQTASGTCNDGTSYFLTIPAGQYVAESQVQADRNAFTAASKAIIGHSICLGSLVPSGCCRNTFYFGIISILKTDPTVTVELVSGSLPAGLTMVMESDRVVIEGTPSEFGTSHFTLTASGSSGVFTTKTYSITIIGITTSGALSSGFLSTPYSAVIMAASVDLFIQSGSLPPGLSLNPSTGIISGTPTASGNYTFTVAQTSGGITCQSICSINIQGINWDLMVWSDIVNGVGSGGSASGVYVGKAFSVSALGTDGAHASSSEANGTLVYTGPAVNCNLRVVVTAGPTNNVGFVIKQDGVTRLQINNTIITTPGTYDLPFALIAGVNSVITITGIVSIGHPAGLFVWSFDNALGAYSGVFSSV